MNYQWLIYFRFDRTELARASESTEQVNMAMALTKELTSTTFATTPDKYHSDTDELDGLQEFRWKYAHIHGYVAVVVCSFGAITNILNIIVLTRKHMLSSTNYILTALAMSDFLVMLTYLITAAYFFIIKKPYFDQDHSIGWMYFILINNLFIITCHNLSNWLFVTLGMFRYISVCCSVTARRHTSILRAKIAVCLVVISTMLLCLPLYFLYKVVKLSEFFEGMPGYWIVASTFAHEHPTYTIVIWWLFGAIIKIVPCVLLTILSTLIIIKIKQGIRRRRILLNQAQTVEHDVNHEHNRTTYMLMSVVILFVLTEFPQGVLAMIAGMNDFFSEKVYSALGDLMDALTLINSAVNFILYCGMSQKFRDTFRSLFLKGCSNHVQKPRSIETIDIEMTTISLTA